ncbi:MAG TPA: dTDP-4-dehydrorhamnose 3,5-epimerase [Chitinophagaceae bacterium]|nr:dTDP-4-dehydrorhamnose 3,5-epimerase [Chitinophagaceae bacterium]
MPFIKTEFPGLLIFQPEIWEDSRGYFFESYNQKVFEEEEIKIQFVQDNQARSTYGVIRGLHYQLDPYAQTKLIRVLSGNILDAVVDIRKNSPTYGKAFTIELSAENKKQLLVPKGFAHGYSVISDTAEVFYKCDEFYNKDSESGIAYNDTALNIDWGVKKHEAIVSKKDITYPGVYECNSNFVYKG